MKRRNFLAAGVALPFLNRFAFGQKRNHSGMKIIKPKRLKAGDTVGVISPSSSISPESLEKALQNLSALGLKTKVGKHARAEKGFLAGADQERLHDLHWAFGDNEIDAVWCARGGYGLSRLLPEVDYKLIRRNPKIFIGYSDITALHVAIFQNTGLVTFHGPVASSEFSDYSKTHVVNTLMNPSAPCKIELSAYNQAQEGLLFKVETITPGRCRGPLTGGNLSLLSAMAGTPSGLKNLKGKILFMEDIEERPYRVDRMLTQLRQSVDLRSLAGIALGVFEGCNPPAGRPSQTVQDVLKDRLGDLGVPVIYGLSFGHIRDQFTLPLGVEAELDAEKATLTLLETGVV
jgi:muramoyltetrapeptide carboxypeptidase